MPLLHLPIRFIQLFILLILIWGKGQCQTIDKDSKRILETALYDVNLVNCGEYKIAFKIKAIGNKDTLKYDAHCMFLNSTLDSTKLKTIYSMESGGYTLKFDGKTLYTISSEDSTVIIENAEGNKDIGACEGNISHNLLFAPYIFKKSKINDFLNPDSGTTVHYDGEVKFNGSRFLKITRHLPDQNGLDSIYESLFFTHECFPMGFVVTLNYNGMRQFQEQFISTLTFNKGDIKKQVNKELPGYFKILQKKQNTIIKSISSHDSPPLFKGFVLNTKYIKPLYIQNDSFSTKNLKTQLILVDFWYMSCLPCLKATDVLDSISIEYNKKLIVLGVNPIDKDKELLSSFIDKRKMLYSTLFNAGDISNAFSISAYPTLYLIDYSKNKIVFKQEGYSYNLGKTLRNAIDAYLKGQ